MVNKIVVTTPMGKIGSHVIQSLLDAGESIVLITRHPEKLDPEVLNKVEIIQGSIDDVSILSKALMEAKSLFWCVPASNTQDNVLEYYLHFTQALVNAIQQTQAPRIVAVSSGGKGLAKNAGPISALHAMEDLLNTTNAEIKYLRCGNFMENFLWQVQPIKKQGMFFYPLPTDFSMPMVAAKDIGLVAAIWLRDQDWSGQTGTAVQGFEDLSFNQAATIFSEVLGKPISYQPVSPQAYYESMLGHGCSNAFAQSLLDMFAQVEQGIYQAESRTVETTTPTTLKEWSQAFLTLT